MSTPSPTSSTYTSGEYQRVPIPNAEIDIQFLMGSGAVDDGSRDHHSALALTRGHGPDFGPVQYDQHNNSAESNSLVRCSDQVSVHALTSI